MAGRILNRRVLREQAEAVVADTPRAPPTKKQGKARAPAAAKVKRARAKKAPPRLRARWAVFDAGMKQVAIFDYNQRAAADEKLADLQAKKKCLHFLQIVKELMPDPVALEEPAVP